MAVKADPGGFPQRKASEVPAVSAIEMREIQRVAQEEYGVDILQIMENAGRSVAMLALQMLGGRGRGQHVAVLAGGGNTGGAGLCAVRHLVNWGVDAEGIFAEVEAETSFLARRQLQILRNAGIMSPADEELSEYALEEQLATSELVIDALAGYGLEGAPAGMVAAATDVVMRSGRPVLAVDVPTGLNATTGLLSTPGIRAVTTLTLDLPKRGCLVPDARAAVGALYLADLGIPRTVHERLGLRLGNLFSEGPILRLRR
ncbi:MAG TPA: NAD(P)H-hydrate epimerase [Tepidiformaceae bacterium]|nr:NAD(P)H-hydrate epimerase [Tepidiformaceae bacterium]